jgi:protein-disulfide isomerase
MTSCRTLSAGPATKTGDVTPVQFFDYNCPYYRRVAPTAAELEASHRPGP